jgi:hypothetical protein
MWCESAQKQCPYLNDISNMSNRSIVGRLTDTIDEEYYAEVEDTITKIVENTNTLCEPAFCEVLAWGTRHTILRESIANVKKRRIDSNGR